MGLPEFVMKLTQKILAVALFVLLAGAVYGFLRTGELAELGKKKPVPAQAPLVDQTALKTAQELAGFPTSASELLFAREALRLADYGLDLAFAQALRDAKEHPRQLSVEAKEIQGRLDQAQHQLVQDKARVEQLDEALDKARDEKKKAIDEELDVVKAQVELDQDEVDDARQDLIRTGGDPEGRIRAMVEEHESVGHGSDKAIGAAPASTEHGVVARVQQWWSLHQKQMGLWRAKADADSRAAALAAEHNALEQELDRQKASTPALQHHSNGGGAPEQGFAPPPGENPEDLLDKTQRIASGQKTLAGIDKRVDAEKGLSDNYGEWIRAVAAEQRSVLHRIWLGIAIILAIGLVGLYFDRWLEKLLGTTRLDRRQVETLRTVTRVAVQVVAVILILLVIIGPPGQLGTFVGLATAGLTVALKDFIVGFIGWLVLMGKNGIRLGDWVEINSVTGEVVELGMFHTVLLETGNWTDSGHPTGRRVTFTNSFAIEGHYFNFSTSGQWLWDELSIVLPAGQDPYPIIEAIQKKVMEATAESARQAEQEWQRATRSKDMSGMTAAPAINVKPVVGGIEVTVRYITRANERYRLRAKLYQAAVDLLGQKAAPVPALAETNSRLT
jgi:small-conductance mechanosensitive channel